MTPAPTDTVTWELSGFGDEADPDPLARGAVLLAFGAGDIGGGIRTAGLGVPAVATSRGLHEYDDLTLEVAVTEVTV